MIWVSKFLRDIALAAIIGGVVLAAAKMGIEYLDAEEQAATVQVTQSK